MSHNESLITELHTFFKSALMKHIEQCASHPNVTQINICIHSLPTAKLLSLDAFSISGDTKALCASYGCAFPEQFQSFTLDELIGHLKTIDAIKIVDSDRIYVGISPVECAPDQDTEDTAVVKSRCNKFICLGKLIVLPKRLPAVDDRWMIRSHE